MPTGSIVPLLQEPAMPVLETQAAIAQGVASLGETARWRYHLRYWHEHRPQDEVNVTASFNLALPDATPATGGDAPACIHYGLRAQLDYSDDGERFEALRLTREHDASGPAGGWPDADYRGSAGSPVDLGNGTGDGDVRTYVFDPAVPAEGWPNFGLTWSGLATAAAQNARASLAVVRNRGLEAPAGTETVVYRTATVDAAQPVAPHNRWPQDFDIRDLGATVDTALDAAFAALFGERRIGQRVTIGVSCGYRVLDTDTAPVAYLPVGLYPDLSIGATTAAQIATTLAQWQDTQSPATQIEWLFSLAQFSQLDTRAPQALLALERMVYRLHPRVIGSGEP